MKNLLYSILAILILYYFLRRIFLAYIEKHKETLFEDTEPLSSQCKELGNKIENQKVYYDNYIKSLGLYKIHYCSSSVVSNASNNKIKYLLKYSDLENNMECLEKLEFCINFVKLHSEFTTKTKLLSSQILNKIPNISTLFISQKKLPFLICDINWKLHKLDVYSFQFYYSSPAGKSTMTYTIPISQNVMELLQSEISSKINKKGHSLSQRSTMTNDLREAIKKRDNYTCCICGNSVFNEPNLLLEVDHIIPISKGGKTEASNLQTLCWRCNRSKSNN